MEILECELEDKKEENLPPPLIPKIEIKKEKPEKYNPAEYKKSKEFKEYETNIC